MKKRLFTLVISILLVLTLCVPAFAVEDFSTDMKTAIVSGQLVISDPNTGEQWNWDLPVTDISARFTKLLNRFLMIFQASLSSTT